MEITVHVECPKCYREIEVLCEPNEGVYLDEYCEECSYVFSQDEYYEMYSKAEEDAIGKLTDRAMDKGD